MKREIQSGFGLDKIGPQAQSRSMSGARFQWINRHYYSAHGKVASIALLLCLAGLVGFFLPSELRRFVPALRLIDAALTILLGLLSWEFFQLVVPARCFYFKKWRVLRLVCVPVIWAVFVVALAICLSQIRDQYPYFYPRFDQGFDLGWR